MPRQTTFAKQGEVEPNWRHVNAEGQNIDHSGHRTYSLVILSS